MKRRKIRNAARFPARCAAAALALLLACAASSCSTETVFFPSRPAGFPLSTERTSKTSGTSFVSDPSGTSAAFGTPTDQTPSPTDPGPAVSLTAEPSTSPTPSASPTPTVSPVTPTPSPVTPDLPGGRKMPDNYLREGFGEPKFKAPQSFVYDVTNGRFLYLHGNAGEISPASTTKLLTILFARTLLPDDLVVEPGDELELVGANSSLAYIRSDKGHKLTVEQLIEGMLLPSGNDAAHVLAAAGGRAIDPTVENGKAAVAVFMSAMNDYARSIGLCGSYFITPDGYDVEGHYSSLEDMAIVARLAYSDELIRKYCAMPTDRVVYASGHVMEWSNTNWCIDPYSPEYYVPEMNGMKTGAKEKGYYCFIGSAKVWGRDYVFGFFAESVMTDRFTDAKTAVTWLKNFT